MVMLRLDRLVRYRRVQHTTNAHREIVAGSLGRRLASNKAAPCLMALVHNLSCVALVLRLAGERKCVLGLAIGDLVDAEGG